MSSTISVFPTIYHCITPGLCSDTSLSQSFDRNATCSTYDSRYQSLIVEPATIDSSSFLVLKDSGLPVYDINTSLSTVVLAHCEDIRIGHLRLQQQWCSEEMKRNGTWVAIWEFYSDSLTMLSKVITGYTCKSTATTSVSSNNCKDETGLGESIQTLISVAVLLIIVCVGSLEQRQLPVPAASTSSASNSSFDAASDSIGTLADELTVKPVVIEKTASSNATTSTTQADAADELTVKPKSLPFSAVTPSDYKLGKVSKTDDDVTDEPTVKPRFNALTPANNEVRNQFKLSELSIDNIVKMCRPCSYGDSSDKYYESQENIENKDLQEDLRCSEPAEVYKISNKILAEVLDCISCDDIRDLTDVAARLPRPELPCSDYKGVWGYDLYSTSYSEHFETFKEVVKVCRKIAIAIDRETNRLEFGHRLTENINQLRELICALHCIPENSRFSCEGFEIMQGDFETFRLQIGAIMGRKLEKRYVHEVNDMAESLLEQWSTFMNERSDYLLGIYVDTCCIIEKYRHILQRNHEFCVNAVKQDV